VDASIVYVYISLQAGGTLSDWWELYCCY